MKRIYLFLLFIPSMALADPCDIPFVIQQIRPGAQWSILNNDYSQITWLDKVQTEPTLEQVNQAIITCQSTPPPPTLKDRVSALETAVQAIATATNVPISLPISQGVTP